MYENSFSDEMGDECADLYSNELNGCCGVVEVYEFSNDSTKSLIKDLKKCIKHAAEECKALIIATTIPSQKKAVRELTEVGFIAQEPAYRPKSRSRPITLWIYTVSPRRPKNNTRKKSKV